MPVGWQGWRSWEDVPIDVWEDWAADSGFHVRLLGCDLFLAAVVRWPHEETEVGLYPPRPRDSVSAWEFMPSDLDDHYESLLEGFGPIDPDDAGGLNGRLIAVFVPWDDGDYRHPDGFELWELATGGFRIVDAGRTISRSFGSLIDAVAAFRALAPRFGASPEGRDTSWPDQD